MSDWFEAEQRMERAQEMYESGRLEEALRELRAALSADPQRGEWRFTLGQVLDALGRFDEAADAYSRVLDHEGETPRVLAHLGCACLNAGRNREAVEALEQSARLDPSDATPRVHLIDAYRRLGDHESAELMFYLACQGSDVEPRSYLYMAWSLLDRGLPDRALPCLRRVRSLDPREPELYAAFGEAHRLRGDLDKARRAYSRQLRTHPGDTEARFELGRVLADLDRPIEAGECFRQVLQLDPGCAQAHLELACLALDAGKLDAAQVDLEIALRLDDTLPEVRQKLAAIMLRRGRLIDACAHLAIELSMPDHEQTPELGDLLMDAGMHREAAEVLHKLTAASPGDADLWHRLSAALFLLGDLPAGIAACRRTLRLNRDHLPALQNLTLAYRLTGRIDRARGLLRRAMEIDPEDPRTRRLQLEIFYTRWRTRLGSA